MDIVCQFSTVHAADDIRIALKECVALADAGYDVRLFARSPKGGGGPSGPVRVSCLPPVRGRAARLSSGLRQAIIQAARSPVRIFHFHDPELILAGVIIKMLGKRVVYDVHEDLPRQVQSKPWIPPALRPLVAHMVRGIEALASHVFDGIVAATPDIARRFPEGKTITVQNFPFLKEFGGESQPSVDVPLRNAVAYVGGLYRTRGVAEMVAALDHTSVAEPPTLVLAGPLGDRLAREVVEKVADNSRVEYHPWLNRLEVQRLYGSVRAGLVVLHPEPRFMTSFPVKMFEYMAAGLPVIASDFPLWREIIGEAECGLLVDPLDPAAIARAIDWVISNPREAEEMGRRGRAAVERQYNWDAEAHKLVEFYNRLLA